MLAFALGFAAGIMLLISLMEMLPAALHTVGMSPMLGYGMFMLGLLAILRWTGCCHTASARFAAKTAPAAQPETHRRVADAGHQPAQLPEV